jgi:processive 1,2-diacylglycerol beta-glucosyltransferase
VIRALFLSANVGDGHSSAANAICASLDDAIPGTRSLVVDSYRYAALVMSRVVSNGYLSMVKTIPQMYRFLYHRAERATEVGPLRTWAHQFAASNLRPLMEREQPDVVVCTHAFPCGAMAEYKAAYSDAPPVVGVVTDFAVHGFWVHENVDAYAVATDAIAEALYARMVPEKHVIVSGIPVRAGFEPPQETKSMVRTRLGLPQGIPLVLLMGGGLGIGPLEEMLHALEALERPVAAVAIAGRNVRGERRAHAVARELQRSVRVLGFVDDVFDYMHACDALVTKPGGLTTAEALVAGIPMVLCRPLPGQEERNARYLVDRGCAVRAHSVADLPRLLDDVLWNPPRRDRMIAAASHVRRPQAAAEIAALITRLARAPREEVA